MKDSKPWISKSLIKRSARLADHAAYQKAMDEIARMNESAGMKHILADYVTDLALADKKIPDKLLSRKKSAAFLDSVKKSLQEDKGLFEIAGMIAMICVVLVCMFVKAVMTDKYVINFSVDALIAAAAFGFLILNLRSQWKVIRYYGSAKDYILLDLAALALWFCFLLLFPAVDSSLLVFLIVYFIEKTRLKKQMEQFLKDHAIPLSLDK